jgi:FkbM family methyltransferase
MLKKVLSLLRALLALGNVKKLRVFNELYRATKFDAAVTPSWSQGGEDLALDLTVLNEIQNGFYLDIGAHDPNRFSVTRRLYQRGWTGIDVDGNPSYINKFQRFRPRNTFMNICVGFREEYEFVVFEEGAISTTNKTWEEKFTSEGNTVSRVEFIKGKKLREILDLPNTPSRVDFINIDIEGADEEALRSIEFESLPIERFPRWLLLETAPPISSSLEFPAVKYAIEHGYQPWLVLPMATLLKAPE